MSKKRVLLPYRNPIKVRPYESAVRAAGMEPVSVLTSGSVSLGSAAGLLLLGGTDVNPKHYGAAAHPETDSPDDERDAVELELIHEALENDLPILGICRGLQILNVYHCGTLIQHLPDPKRHDPNMENPGSVAHEVTIEPDTLLAAIAGATVWRVNSRHHQAVDQPGERLSVTARASEDGVVEALERHDKHFVLAVQWHPEDQVGEHPEQLKLFERFRDALL